LICCSCTLRPAAGPAHQEARSLKKRVTNASVRDV
jgi:hypothetical protein